MVVVKDQLDRIKQNERLGVEAAAAVEADITALLQGKSYDHLVVLQKSIQAKLTSGEPIDFEYWESLLKKLLVWKSKAKLKSLHEVVVRNRLEQLRKRQRDEALQAQEELLAGVARSAARGERPNAIAENAEQANESTEEQEPYDRAMSPPLIDITKLPYEERQIDIVTELEDLRALVSGILSFVICDPSDRPHSSRNAVPSPHPGSSLVRRSRSSRCRRRARPQAMPT